MTRAQTAIVLLLACATALATDQGSPPPGCHWQEIPDVKVVLAVPDGWKFQELPKKGDARVYEVLPAGPGIPDKPDSRYELRVQRITPVDRAAARAKEYVQNAVATSAGDPSIEEEQIGVVKMFASVGQLSPDDNGVAKLTIAVSSAANTKTGALYTMRFDIPGAELTAVQPMANELFRRIRLDDEF